MMYTYDFQIAGLLFRVNSPFALADLFELSAFQVATEPDKTPDALYSIELLPQDWLIRGTKISQGDRSAIYEWQNELHYYYFWNLFSTDLFVLLKRRKDNVRCNTIYLQEATVDRILPQFRLSAFFAPEHLLLSHKAFLLHASVIDWQGQGILFTAPSGVGKSTQANLWTKLEGAKLLNGDKAIIRYQHDEFFAYGSPYAGTSGVYQSHAVPIRAIVVLSQATENSIHQLPAGSAFRRIFPETTALCWDPTFMEGLTELVLHASKKIHVFHLACRPDAGAVNALKQALTP